MKTVAIIGHPLAAEENRLAFQGWRNLRPHLIAPAIWPVRSLGVTYEFSPSPLGGLPCLLPGHNSIFLWRGLSRALSSLRPSLIYSWEEPWALSTSQALRWAGKHGIPFVFYSAENRPKSLPLPFRILLRKVFRQARACIVPTEAVSENIVRMGFSGSVLRIPLWLAQRAQIRPDYSRRILAYVGRLIPLKRVDLLIQSLPLLPEFTLRIIGDGPERESLATLAQNLGVTGRVDFLGHVPNAHLEKALEGCACAILPTASTGIQAEQFGKAALEAALCGLPALVSDSGQLPLWAEKLTTIRRIGAWTPEAVSNSVLTLWNSPPSPESLLASRQWVWEHYGFETVGKQMERAFADILEGRT